MSSVGIAKRSLAVVVERTDQTPRARVYRDPSQIEFVPYNEIRDDKAESGGRWRTSNEYLNGLPELQLPRMFND